MTKYYLISTEDEPVLTRKGEVVISVKFNDPEIIEVPFNKIIQFKTVKVKTLTAKHDDAFTPEWRNSRKWGVKGKIIEKHDSHGLCYEVKHEDGSIGCYEPDEIELI